MTAGGCRVTVPAHQQGNILVAGAVSWRMSKLKIREDLTGTEIRFPMSGMPATSTEGKMYRAAFLACIMLPGLMTAFDGYLGFALVALASLAMMLLAVRSRKLSLYLDQRTLQIRAPWNRHAIPLEEITGFEAVKDSHTSMFYLLAHTREQSYTASTLMSRGDVERLEGLIQASRTARLAEDLSEPARPPEALRALVSGAQQRL